MSEATELRTTVIKLAKAFGLIVGVGLTIGMIAIANGYRPAPPSRSDDLEATAFVFAKFCPAQYRELTPKQKETVVRYIDKIIDYSDDELKAAVKAPYSRYYEGGTSWCASQNYW